MAHVAEWKKEEVKELKGIIKLLSECPRKTLLT